MAEYNVKQKNKLLQKNNNIEYGGLAFNQENYISLSEDIEKQKPDVFIYENIRKKFCTNFKMKEAFNTLMRAEHFRLSLDNKTIWNNFENICSRKNNTKE